MSSALLSETDYRNAIPGIDKYGRKLCSNCNKHRKVNAWWKDTNRVLCKVCSVAKDVAFMHSVRGQS